MSARLFVGLGSNIGDRLAHLHDAIERLAAHPELELGRRSGLWETRPLGPGSGPFVNAAIELHARLDAVALMEELLRIEAEHGRVRRIRWGDRTLDLDLLCGFAADGRELIIDAPTLTLPHPNLAERDFVLQPLVDIDPQLHVGGRSCAELLDALDDDQRTLLRRVDA